MPGRAGPVVGVADERALERQHVVERGDLDDLAATGRRCRHQIGTRVGDADEPREQLVMTGMVGESSERAMRGSIDTRTRVPTKRVGGHDVAP